MVVVVFLAFEYIAADKKNVMWTHKQEEEDDKDQPASPASQTIIIIRRCVAAITAKLLFRNFCQRSSEEKGMRVQREEV